VSIAGDVFFYLVATVAILCAVATVMVKSPIRAAVGLLGHIIALAALYITLHAHLLAALQLIVYAGAVVVLFIFVIMLIGPTPIAPTNARGLATRAVGAGLMGIFASAIAFSLTEIASPRAGIPICPPGASAECGQFGGVEALGRELYTHALVPFELVSVLLLVAIVGAVAIARGRSAEDAAAAKARRVEEEAAAAAEAVRAKALSAEVAAHEGHGH